MNSNCNSNILCLLYVKTHRCTNLFGIIIFIQSLCKVFTYFAGRGVLLLLLCCPHDCTVLSLPCAHFFFLLALLSRLPRPLTTPKRVVGHP